MKHNELQIVTLKNRDLDILDHLFQIMCLLQILQSTVSKSSNDRQTIITMENPTSFRIQKKK